MSVTVQLPAETETKLRDKAAQVGKTPEAFLVELVEKAVGNNAADASSGSLTGAERAAAWRSWAASHKAKGVIADDSRDSIYQGCGE
jgi:hypothetical protein